MPRDLCAHLHRRRTSQYRAGIERAAQREHLEHVFGDGRVKALQGGQRQLRQVHALLQDAVSHVNAQLARTDRIQRFAVTATEFTLEGGELTPTLKVLRGVIASRYATTFDALYQ